VAPAFLDLVDDPTMEAGPGQAVLFGAYAADAEGVPAQRVSLVERGVMKSLLMSRIPRKELARSNGHARLGATGERGELGVLVVKGKGALGERALRERALAEARAQGPGTPVYIVRRVSSGWGSLAEQHGWISALTAPRGGSIGIGYGSRAHGTLEPEVVLRLKEDGSEEPVSGVRFANFLPRQLRDIVAVGETPGVYNVPSGELPWVVGGRGSSVITPALLLRDVELKR
jgi:hypothetical protein